MMADGGDCADGMPVRAGSEARPPPPRPPAGGSTPAAPPPPPPHGPRRLRSPMRVLATAAVAALATAAAAAPARADLVLDGHGWGHGVGMSQYGAYGYALLEHRDHAWILGHYYAGTTLARSRRG